MGIGHTVDLESYNPWNSSLPVERLLLLLWEDLCVREETGRKATVFFMFYGDGRSVISFAEEALNNPYRLYDMRYHSNM